jgi:hypothetical protein
MFAVEEHTVTRLSFIMRLSGQRQRERYAWTHTHTGEWRDAANQTVHTRIIDTVDRWARRYVRRRGMVPVSEIRITSAAGEYDMLFGDPDARRLHVSIRALPADTVVKMVGDTSELRIPDGEFRVFVAVPRKGA